MKNTLDDHIFMRESTYPEFVDWDTITDISKIDCSVLYTNHFFDGIAYRVCPNGDILYRYSEIMNRMNTFRMIPPPDDHPNAMILVSDICSKMNISPRMLSHAARKGLLSIVTRKDGKKTVSLRDLDYYVRRTDRMYILRNVHKQLSLAEFVDILGLTEKSLSRYMTVEMIEHIRKEGISPDSVRFSDLGGDGTIPRFRVRPVGDYISELAAIYYANCNYHYLGINTRNGNIRTDNGLLCREDIDRLYYEHWNAIAYGDGRPYYTGDNILRKFGKTKLWYNTHLRPSTVCRYYMSSGDKLSHEQMLEAYPNFKNITNYEYPGFFVLGFVKEDIEKYVVEHPDVDFSKMLPAEHAGVIATTPLKLRRLHHLHRESLLMAVNEIRERHIWKAYDDMSKLESSIGNGMYKSTAELENTFDNIIRGWETRIADLEMELKLEVESDDDPEQIRRIEWGLRKEIERSKRSLDVARKRSVVIIAGNKSRRNAIGSSGNARINKARHIFSRIIVRNCLYASDIDRAARSPNSLVPITDKICKIPYELYEIDHETKVAIMTEIESAGMANRLEGVSDAEMETKVSVDPECTGKTNDKRRVKAAARKAREENEAGLKMSKEASKDRLEHAKELLAEARQRMSEYRAERRAAKSSGMRNIRNGVNAMRRMDAEVRSVNADDNDTTDIGEFKPDDLEIAMASIMKERALYADDIKRNLRKLRIAERADENRIRNMLMLPELGTSISGYSVLKYTDSDVNAYIVYSRNKESAVIFKRYLPEDRYHTIYTYAYDSSKRDIMRRHRPSVFNNVGFVARRILRQTKQNCPAWIILCSGTSCICDPMFASKLKGVPDEYSVVGAYGYGHFMGNGTWGACQETYGKYSRFDMRMNFVDSVIGTRGVFTSNRVAVLDGPFIAVRGRYLETLIELAEMSERMPRFAHSLVVPATSILMNKLGVLQMQIPVDCYQCSEFDIERDSVDWKIFEDNIVDIVNGISRDKLT